MTEIFMSRVSCAVLVVCVHAYIERYRVTGLHVLYACM